MVLSRRGTPRLAAAAAAFTLAASAAPAPRAQDRLTVERAGSQVVAVPPDQAIVVRSARPFAEVSIAQPAIADVQPLSDRSVYVIGRGRGRTTLTLIDAAGELVSNVVVSVEPDVAELKERLATLLPGEPVEVRATGGGVALSGVVSGARQVEQAVTLARAYAGDDVANLITVGGAQQAALRVRIAEVNRSAAKELGVGLGVAADGDVAIGTNGQLPVRNGLAGEVLGFANPVASGFAVLDAIVSVGESLLIDVSIDALEEKGYARTLAEPTLVALSGATASFLAGGEVPIPIIQEEGVEIDFRSVGVNLDFTPTVLTEDTVSVTVGAEVASVEPTLGVSTLGVEVPGFTVRRANTTVELRDGQSFAIAGLYQDDFSDMVRQVPWLGDLPVLGALFRSTEFQRGETELVIVVTVDLVAPVDEIDVIETPFGASSVPDERDLFLFGEVEARSPEAAAFAADGVDGAYGYVLD